MTVDRGEHSVVAFAGVLGDSVAGIVHEIEVVAGPALREVGAAVAVQEIVPDVTVEGVRVAVAVALQVCAALQHQGLHVGRQPVMHGRKDRVVACAGALEHRIVGIVDEVGVVACAAHHDVGAAVAVEEVVAGVAVEGVGEAVAVALQIGAALQHQRFHVGLERVVDRREHRIDAFAGILHHHVAGVVDEVGVAAGAALHESAPTPPSSRLIPLLPVSVLAMSLPQPCRSALPSSTRFSRFAASV